MSKGYDQIFNAKAEVEFHGCNVAEGYRGEFFLIRFGKTFLKETEGTLAGITRLDSTSAMRLRIPGASGSRLIGGLGHKDLEPSWVADRMAELRVSSNLTRVQTTVSSYSPAHGRPSTRRSDTIRRRAAISG